MCAAEKVSLIRSKEKWLRGARLTPGRTNGSRAANSRKRKLFFTFCELGSRLFLVLCRRSFMPGIHGKQLSALLLIFVLTVGMKSQSPTGASQPTCTSSHPSAAAPPAPVASNDQKPGKPQKPAPVYESATVLKTITRLVVVDVVATDKNGPVTNLERPDFTIVEDGKEQQIRVFNFQQPHA